MFFFSHDEPLSELLVLIGRQLKVMWGLGSSEESLLDAALKPALARILTNYNEVKEGLPRYRVGGQPAFSPLHSDQYGVFLHYLREETVQLDEKSTLSDKLFALNKMLHSIDFYSAKLPSHFMVSHPLGAIIGRADFKPGGHCLIYQQVTIGGNHGRDGELNYPSIGDHVILYAGASVIGRAQIGDFSILGMGAAVKNENVPSSSLVFGASPNLIIKPLSLERYAEFSPYRVNA